MKFLHLATSLRSVAGFWSKRSKTGGGEAGFGGEKYPPPVPVPGLLRPPVRAGRGRPAPPKTLANKGVLRAFLGPTRRPRKPPAGVFPRRAGTREERLFPGFKWSSGRPWENPGALPAPRGSAYHLVDFATNWNNAGCGDLRVSKTTTRDWRGPRNRYQLKITNPRGIQESALFASWRGQG